MPLEELLTQPFYIGVEDKRQKLLAINAGENILEFLGNKEKSVV
jgi:hypothetical protein